MKVCNSAVRADIQDETALGKAAKPTGALIAQNEPPSDAACIAFGDHIVFDVMEIGAVIIRARHEQTPDPIS